MLFFYRLKGKQGSAQQRQGKQHRINWKVVVVQQRWSQYLTRKIGSYSKRTLRVVTVLFVLISSSFSLWVAVSSFDKNTKELILTAASPIVLHHPAHNSNTGIAEEGFSTLQRFTGYLDSLQKSPAGKSTYDRLLKERPGLLDSIQMLQTIYLQQQKRMEYEKEE